jgi:SAM-dependent methyltransferase
MDITTENLSGKVVLEIGTGRGSTTRYLVDLLSRFEGAALVATDVSGRHLAALQREFKDGPVPVQFLQTSATRLNGIADGSVDFVVCNYTLCAINAIPGDALFALRRFFEVLKEGGSLYVEEEFPIQHARGLAQEVWAEKWRALKAATVAAGGMPYVEFQPSVLASLCRIAGFDSVDWKEDTCRFDGANVLDFFHKRMERLQPRLPDKTLRAGFRSWAERVQDKAAKAGGMEVPYYHLQAQKCP